MVCTADPTRLIEEFQVGDTILSKSENDPDSPLQTRRVEKLFKLSAPVIELQVGGQLIETTAEHPFFVIEKGWVRARDLITGDMLVGHDDKQTPVESISTTERTETVYNLRVAEDHTYFVGSDDWGFSVWVHNAYSYKKLADGTYQIIDDLGDVVKTGVKNLDDAKAFVSQFNKIIAELTPLDAAVGRGMRILRGTGAPGDMVGVLKKLGKPMNRNKIGEVIHDVKRKMGIGADEDLIFDYSGGMWDSRTGEYIGKMWEAI